MIEDDRTLTPYVAEAEALVRETHQNGGLAPVDIDRFWADQKLAEADPFGEDIPQVPMGIRMGGQCVFDELGVPEDAWRYHHDEAWRLGLNKAYNDKAEATVGLRLLSETPSDPSLEFPETGGLHDVFEAERQWHAQSWWLMQSAGDVAELEALLDRVEGKDVRRVILPDNWETERDRLAALGLKPRLYRGQRGPVTFAASI